MSQETAMAFRNKLGEDAGLQAQAKPILEGGQTEELVKLGQKHGYEFTAEDVKHVLTEIAGKNVELTDFELEAVAGGQAATYLSGGGGGSVGVDAPVQYNQGSGFSAITHQSKP